MPKKPTPKAAKITRVTHPDPQFATYLIKKVDRGTWARMVERAKSDGRSLSWLFHDWIRNYADGQ